LTRPISPGVAFGCVELLGAASRNALTPGGVLSLSLGAIPPKDVLETAFDLRWIEVSEGGLLAITARGDRALASGDDRFRLRTLVFDYIDAENPPWLQLASSGRRELLLQAPAGLQQLLVEAGLAYGEDADTVIFWDILAARARGMRNAALSETGRRGEMLTLAHELERTGRAPKWIALDSNNDGYDVLSQISAEDTRRLTIEVKASERSALYGVFHVTRNEWELAEESLQHMFHLWDLSGTVPRLATLSVTQVCEHIPYDRGDGRWESIAIPFGAFARSFASPVNYTEETVSGCGGLAASNKSG
jgi:hypothetical protein